MIKVEARDEAILALTMAIRHIEHMANWIGKQKAGYSFESLNEDMPSIREVLDRLKK